MCGFCLFVVWFVVVRLSFGLLSFAGLGWSVGWFGLVLFVLLCSVGVWSSRFVWLDAFGPSNEVHCKLATTPMAVVIDN